MDDYEKLGVFYLGKEYDLEQRQTLEQPVLYASKDLTTHAMCVGMTGSGKTGLCIGLMEEAAIDGIPSIIIDPKGDLSNLLLTFPELRGTDFAPWVDPQEAQRANLSVEQFAEEAADRWRKGLVLWNQSGERIRKFKEAVDVAVYTPGSNLGLPLAVLRSLAAPPASLQQDTEAFRQRVQAAVSGLLALLQIEADPLQSREHIFLSNLLEQSWRAEKNLDLPALIGQIQSPPIRQIGVIDVESFYPAKQRFELAMRLNNLIASPGFSAWTTGEPLEIQRLLFTPQGKPRCSILSISHLSDSERMFFVTVLLNEMISWMRTQSGTSSLRALLYMDEIYGFFPPTANPPSKPPMLLLLKQARAFGLGIVLATQNPVDLDYKGLSNCGTWFLGRLQTEGDKRRVLDGLEGASAAANSKFDRAAVDSLLSRLGSRVFLLNNVHEDAPVLFQTRWTLSYLRGPLMREQIQKLMQDRKTAAAGQTLTQALPSSPSDAKNQRPLLPPDVPTGFLPLRGKITPDLVYRPALLGMGKLHYVNAKTKLDSWVPGAWLATVGSDISGDVWESAERLDFNVELENEPQEGIPYAPVPAEMLVAKNYPRWSTALKSYCYRVETLTRYECAAQGATSLPEEKEGDFRARLAHQLREQRDDAVAELSQRYQSKLATLQEKERRAVQKLEREKAESKQGMFQTAIAVGGSLLGAVLGSRRGVSATTISKAATAARSAGRMMTQREDVGHAEETLETIQAQRQELEAALKTEIDQWDRSIQPDKLEITTSQVVPRKTDMAIDRVLLVWTPWRTTSAGEMQAAFETA